MKLDYFSNQQDARIIIFLKLQFLGHKSFIVKYNKLFQFLMRAPCFPALKFKKYFSVHVEKLEVIWSDKAKKVVKPPKQP